MTLRKLRQSLKCARGAAAVEFALILMPLCITVMGTLELGYRIYAIAVVNGWWSGTIRRLAPAALLGLVLLPVLAHRNDTYRPSLVIVAGTVLTLVVLTGVVTRPRSAAGSLPQNSNTCPS